MQTQSSEMNLPETPLEQAAREEAEMGTSRGNAALQEYEADVLVADIDDYVAKTDPGSLAEAEVQLNAWEIPTSPLEGTPGNVAVAPDREREPLVAVFSAGSESEANIVRGLLESEGIPATFDSLPSPAMGSVFSIGESAWGDILVPSGQAEDARAVIAAAQSPSDVIDPENAQAS